MVRSVLKGQKEGNECLLGSWMDLLSRIWVVVGSLNCWKQIYSKTGLFCCKIPISWDVTSMEDRIIYCVVDSISLHRRTAYCIECHNKRISKWQGWPDPIKFNLGVAQRIINLVKTTKLKWRDDRQLWILINTCSYLFQRFSLRFRAVCCSMLQHGQMLDLELTSYFPLVNLILINSEVIHITIILIQI